jgi:hypothetical protein
MHAPSSSTTNWSYPNTDGATGAIKQANVNLCLQVDAAADNIVRGAACVNDAAEQWLNLYNSTTGRTIFLSQYYLQQSKNMCLSGAGPLVEVINCTNIGNAWYFQWGSS